MQPRLQLILALIVGLLAGPAFAQDDFTLLGVDNGAAASAPTSFVGLGDVVSGAKAYYGVRAYTAAQAVANVKLLQAQRSSDGASYDVLADATTGGFGAAGSGTGTPPAGSGPAAWQAWCTFSAGSCVVTTVYDQQANHYDASNSAASRPSLVFSGLGSLPSLAFNGSSNVLNINATSTSVVLSISAVAVRTGNTSAYNAILGGATGLNFNNAANQAGAYFGVIGGLAAMSVTDSAWHAMEAGVTSGTMTFNADGASIGTASVGASDLDSNLGIGGAFGGSGSYLAGNIAEVALYASDFSASNAALCHNQNVYYSLGKAC